MMPACHHGCGVRERLLPTDTLAAAIASAALYPTVVGCALMVVTKGHLTHHPGGPSCSTPQREQQVPDNAASFTSLVHLNTLTSHIWCPEVRVVLANQQPREAGPRRNTAAL
jgi:hypothetical protein